MLDFGKFLLVLYLITVTFLYFAQRKMLYFPPVNSPTVNSSTLNSPTAQQDEIVFHVNEQTIQAWQLNPETSHALLYFGGNAEDVSANIEPFLQLFPHHTVYLINYRGYGASTGSPSEQALTQDALAIYDQLTSDYQTISVIGRSLGSGVAVNLSAVRAIKKMILVTPFDSILNVAQDIYWMFPLSFLLKDKFESWRKVEDINADSLVIIAEQDEVIAPKYGHNLVTYFATKPEVNVIIGAGHNNIAEFSAYQLALAEFMQ
ncbi:MULTISPECIES: alpha/beta hydrolase [Colwellia]|uniref:Alpha/beta hydrolase n=1 Tax=Colwellia marinimaniae TaxID=1513592 RepID=A0ABQ0MUH0_9GAMM|nr:MULTISPECIES: alpha/beta hydrolase [Colwellia]GAW95974.1 alpha/beta hydrolase [Colwellia marinimaniae]